MTELKAWQAVNHLSEDVSPITSTRTVLEDNGNSLHSILREINDHLPHDVVDRFPHYWCYGALQNRSIPINTAITLTPGAPIGQSQAGLISGNYFVAPANGIYTLTAQGGQTSGASPLLSYWVNIYNAASVVLVTRPVISTSIPLAGAFPFDGISLTAWLAAGEKFGCHIFSQAALSSLRMEDGQLNYSFTGYAI